MNSLKTNQKKIISLSEEDTKAFAGKLAENLKNLIICLKGSLGSGKTVFVKGFAEKFNIDPLIVKSPTYTYMRIYKTDSVNLYHFDYYRLKEADEAIKEELLEITEDRNSILLIEWPEKILEILPKERTEIEFKTGESPNKRFIQMIHK